MAFFVFHCFKAVFVGRVPVLEIVGRPYVCFVPAAGSEGGFIH